MNFDRPPIAPIIPEREKPKNKLRELLFDGEAKDGSPIEMGAALAGRRIDGLRKSLPEHIRKKRAQEILDYFALLRQLRDRCEAEWFEKNKDRLGGYATLTSAQIAERHRYVDTVDKKTLDDMLVGWVAEWESALDDMDEADKQEQIALIDAAQTLQADMANW